MAAASLLAACSSDMDGLLGDELVSLRVTAEMPATRASINATTFDKGDKVGLFLPAYGYSYMNLPTEWDGKYLRTDNILLGAEKTLVWAYYPYQEDLTNIVVDVEKQENFLFGASDGEVYNKSPYANITFQHAMCLLRLNVTYKAGITLDSVYVSGEQIYRNGQLVITGETPSLMPIPASVTTEDSPIRIKANVSSNKTVIQDVLLMPGDARVAHLVFKYDNHKSFPFNVELPALKMGQQYTLNVTIKEDAYNGHEYVDLGLEDARDICWATCNLGATTAGEYGYYLPWSNTEDPVKAAWKGAWRLPTKKEMQALVDECKWEWVDNGCRVTGPNGKSIFLPAAGLKDGEGNMVKNKDEYGYYLTSQTKEFEGEETVVFELQFNSEPWGKPSCFVGTLPLGFQCSVRPVAPKGMND